MNTPLCPLRGKCDRKCDYRVRFGPMASCMYTHTCFCYREAMMEYEEQQKPTDPNEYEDREEHARDVWPY